MPEPDPPRHRRRAVGPAGARPADPDDRAVRTAGRPDPDERDRTDGDDERWLRDRPPHHDRGV